MHPEVKPFLEDNNNDPEFTDEQLRKAAKRVGQQARDEAFRAGLPVYYLKNGCIVALYPSGTEEIVESLDSGKSEISANCS